ncbi:MAG TPA: flagellar biosynthetic protein FliO [Allosphingosinicella sp.]|jgi:flagellar biogenesis protein FliO
MTRRRAVGRALARAAPAAALLLAAAPAVAQRLGQGGGTEVPVWRVLAALLLCLLLAGGAALALRTRLRGGGPLLQTGQRRLQLVERLRLNQHVDICIVRIREREVVLAASAQGATLLGVAGGDDTEEPAGVA